MFYLAVDEDGKECLYTSEPRRGRDQWLSDVKDMYILPKGAATNILQYPLTWDDEAQEITEYKND